MGSRFRDAGLTALAPAMWGTTYIVTTELLPPARPLLAAALRALPAGLVLLAVARRLPTGSWWWRVIVLGILNFGAFFPLIFVGAYRLPGGVASTIGSIQPIVVALLAAGLLGTRPTSRILIAGLLGTTGIALLVLRSTATLDAVGIIAMLVATSSMGLAIVLAKRWGLPPGVSPLTMASWQLCVGGLLLTPIALIAEGAPPHLDLANLAGFAYLGFLGTALAYILWFRGISRLSPASVSLLGLTNPIMATLVGYVLLNQTLRPLQLLGLALALAGLVIGQLDAALPSRRRTQQQAALPEPV